MTLLANKPVYHTYEDYPIEDLLLYAGIDCVVTSGVAAELVPRMQVEDVFKVETSEGKRYKTKCKPMMWAVENVEQLAHEYIVDMEINGFRYDVEENTRLGKAMCDRMLELEEMIFSGRGYGKSFEIKAAGVSEILYKELKLDPPWKTKSGDNPVDGDVLLYFAKNNGIEWLKWLAERNDIMGAYNTFIKTYVEDFVKRDGRIHPSYNLHGTSSFRITGSEPNLTQLPRTRYGFNLRNCYITDDGYVFLAFDFSSAEVNFAPYHCEVICVPI